jgi:hypothetical protein
MTDQRKLIERLAALIDRDNKPDWEDVVRRAEGAPARAATPARRSKRSYLTRRLVPVFLLVAAAFAFVLIAPWGSSPSLNERALAAIGDEPVIHAVLSGETGKTYIDLATGQSSLQIRQTEIWYDGKRHIEHWRTRIDGQIIYDSLETPTGVTSSEGPFYGRHDDPKLDPALAGFVDSYRSALENGDASVVGPGTVDGHNVTWIEFRVSNNPRWDATERVAVDESSALPLRIEQFLNGKSGGGSDVTLIESLPEGSGNFTAPKAGSAGYTSMRDHGNPVSPADALQALPNALWAGDRVAGLPLSSMMRWTLTGLAEPDSGLKRTTNNGIEIHYGHGWRYADAAVTPPGTTPDGSFAWIEETTTPVAVYSLGGLSEVLPPTGTLVLDYCEARPGTQSIFGRGCHGVVFEKGVYVYISASDRDLLLATARALEPIPTPTGTG